MYKNDGIFTTSKYIFPFFFLSLSIFFHLQGPTDCWTGVMAMIVNSLDDLQPES